MKKTISIAALVLMSSAALFANGNKEDQNNESYGRGSQGGNRQAQDGQYYGRGMMDECYDEDGNLIQLEEITAEGTLVLEEGTMPYLNTADGKVFIMVPPFALGDLELEGGEAVKVTGYDMPTDRWGNETDSVFMRVLTAEIDGEELDLDFDRIGRAHHGGKGGRPSRGGRGNS
jgi:hypothetical protein